MRRYRYMSPAQRDARAEAKRAAAAAAGIPVRTDCDPREPIAFDLSRVGGYELVIEPCRGHLLKWRARRTDTGEVVAAGAFKSVLHALADSLPQARVMDD